MAAPGTFYETFSAVCVYSFAQSNPMNWIHCYVMFICISHESHGGNCHLHHVRSLQDLFHLSSATGEGGSAMCC